MGKRLLIVDADAGLTRVVALTAEWLGLTTLQVNDPMRAIDVFIDFQPEAVMIDLLMPEKDGIDLLDEIMLTGLPTRVIQTSGNGEELLPLAQDVLAFHGAQAAVLLQKPFRRAELVAALTRLTSCGSRSPA